MKLGSLFVSSIVCGGGIVRRESSEIGSVYERQQPLSLKLATNPVEPGKLQLSQHGDEDSLATSILATRSQNLKNILFVAHFR